MRLGREQIGRLLAQQSQAYELLMWFADEANRDPQVLSPAAVATLREPKTAGPWLEEHRAPLLPHSTHPSALTSTTTKGNKRCTVEEDVPLPTYSVATESESFTSDIQASKTPNDDNITSSSDQINACPSQNSENMRVRSAEHPDR